MNLLTPSQAATALGVSVQGVKKMRKRGVLTGVQVSGRLFLFTPKEIEKAKTRRGVGRPKIAVQ